MLLHKLEIEDLIVFDVNQQMLVFHKFTLQLVVSREFQTPNCLRFHQEQR